MTPKSFAAFRQLSVQCDFSEKKPQLKKQLSVDAGLKREWDRFEPALRSTQKSVTIKSSVQKNEGIFARAGKKANGISGCEEEANKRNLKIFLAHDMDRSACNSCETPDPQDRTENGASNVRMDKKPTPTMRPASAATKRQNFQKRLNSVFNATVKERTLVRSTSAPCKTVEQRKSKFVSRHKLLGSRTDHAKTKEPDSDGTRGKKESGRASPVSFHDVETMISLISPSGSDCEESGAVKPEKVDGFRDISDQRVGVVSSLPKEEKSVSFQQSSIHSVRSFSASFPARRLSGNHRMLRYKMRSTSQEKNTSFEKKRLSSTTVQRTFSTDETITPSYDMVTSVETMKPNQSRIEQIEPAEEIEIVPKTEEIVASEKPNDSEEDKIGDFESSKEQQCRILYSRITKNGINVSFDTILRGLLTPTEYRTRQRSLNMSPLSSNADN